MEMRDIQYQLKNLIYINLIQLMLDHSRLSKTRTDSIIVKSQLIVTLFYKIAFLTFDQEYILSSQTLCLDAVLNRIKQIIKLMKIEEKKNKININKNVEIMNINSNYYGQIKTFQTYFDRLNSKKQNLTQEIRQFNLQKRSLSVYSKQQRQQIINQNRQFSQLMRKLQDLKNDENHLIRQVSRFQDGFKNLDHEYNNLLTYVDNQTKNKHLQLASVAKKNIKSQIYEYAVYLQANQLATSEVYEYIPVKNQCFIINKLQKSLKKINKDIVSNQEMPISEKQDLMRKFVLKTHNQYKRKDEQYQKLLDFKTKYIRKFVDMMRNWLDNRTLKQQYLANLRRQFVVDNKNFLEEINKIFRNQQLCNHSTQLLKGRYQSFLSHYQIIEENYKLGNSFYSLFL